MVTRREFVSLATAAAAFAATSSKYDLVIKGGHIIDPSRKLDALLDVGISNGKIAAMAPNIPPSSATEVLDATDKWVVPGLLDIHTHVSRTPEAFQICLSDGVVGLIDAGSRGADNIAEAIANVKMAPQPCKVLINIGRQGVIAEGDTMDLKRADVALAKEAIAKNRDMIVGVKARLSQDVAGANDFEVLKRAQEVASSFKIPVMIHMGQTVSPLSKLLPILKSGDIVTHMFAPPPNSIVDDDGHIRPEVIAARKRGVRFDLGHGRTTHFSWDLAEKVLKTGFLPDTLSTDWTPEGRVQFINLAAVMSKFLMLGMTTDQVVACVTSNASRAFPIFRDHGTLAIGARADIAVLELREGTFDFVDNYEGKRTARHRLFPFATIFGGKRVEAPKA